MKSNLLHTIGTGVTMPATSRREALRTAGRLGAGATLSMIPFIGMAGQVRAARYGSASALAHDVLGFALTLEYLEYFFYKRAVEEADIPSGALPLFQEIRDNELAHVNLLRTTIEGVTDPPGDPDVYEQDDFDYGVAGFDPFAGGGYQNLLVLAQAFEDTGVRAYKGQAPALMDTPYLTVALQIHSVEARHAAAIRRLRDLQGWIPLDQPDAPDAIAAVYGPGSPSSTFPSEANTTQGGVQLTTALSGYTAEEISEAFDEPLDMLTVYNPIDPASSIAGPFITGEPD